MLRFHLRKRTKLSLSFYFLDSWDFSQENTVTQELLKRLLQKILTLDIYGNISLV